jgi:hypothetical protein
MKGYSASLSNVANDEPERRSFRRRGLQHPTNQLARTDKHAHTDQRDKDLVVPTHRNVIMSACWKDGPRFVRCRHHVRDLTYRGSVSIIFNVFVRIPHRLQFGGHRRIPGGLGQFDRLVQLPPSPVRAVRQRHRPSRESSVGLDRCAPPDCSPVRPIRSLPAGGGTADRRRWPTTRPGSASATSY